MRRARTHAALLILTGLVMADGSKVFAQQSEPASPSAPVQDRAPDARWWSEVSTAGVFDVGAGATKSGIGMSASVSVLRTRDRDVFEPCGCSRSPMRSRQAIPSPVTISRCQRAWTSSCTADGPSFNAEREEHVAA